MLSPQRRLCYQSASHQLTSFGGEDKGTKVGEIKVGEINAGEIKVGQIAVGEKGCWEPISGEVFSRSRGHRRPQRLRR